MTAAGAVFQNEGVERASSQHEALASLRIPPGETVTVHMVHVNHLDLVWYWRLPETVEMCLETVRWHVELLERHSDARYSHTQVFILKVVEELDPALFARFARLVREGRIEVDSGQWVEPDHNMPGGESLARQFLYGQRWLREKLGVRARVLVNSDSFGHCRSLPQILRQAGIGFFVFKRPRQRYVDLPETPFRWRGLDGTEIGALRFINKGAGLPSLSQYYDVPAAGQLQAKVDRNLAAGVRHLLGTHCNADSGGVTPYVAPGRGPGWELRYDTPGGFVAELERANPALPLVERDLNFIFPGCYTTHVAEKESCRRSERELRGVELLAVHAALRGEAYPADALGACWREACFLQFHDILPGTGSPEAHADSAAHYHRIFLDLGLLRRRLQLRLDGAGASAPAAPAAAQGSRRAFRVLNPQASPLSDIVEAEVEMPLASDGTSAGRVPEAGLLVDEAGRATPYQIVETRWRQRFGRGTMLFGADDLPPLGARRFEMRPGESAAAGGPFVAARGDVLDNGLLRVEVGGPGLIRSLRLSTDGREWLRDAAAPVRLELWPETDYLGDYGSPMKAWFLGVTDAREDAVPVGPPEVVENGPVRATIRLRHTWGSSTFTTDVSLYRGQEWVELRLLMDWQEKEVLCRLCVEPRLEGAVRRTFGIPFGHQEATGREVEVPAVGWSDVSGSGGGVAVLDRDRIGRCLRDDALRVSLVRCATGDWDPCTDRGTIRTALRIVPHAGSAEDARIPLLADRFRCPPVAWQVEGAERAPLESLLAVDGPVQLSALKRAEDGAGWVARLWEPLGRPAACRLRLGRNLGAVRVREANLLEDPGPELPAPSGCLELDLRPFEIRTLLIESPAAAAAGPGPELFGRRPTEGPVYGGANP